jgi:iron-sulfur cluster assembly protein
VVLLKNSCYKRENLFHRKHREEIFMLEVTDKATEMVREFFKSRDSVTPMRIFVAGVACSGPQLGMALDEATDADEKIETDGFTYLIEKQLLEDAKPIKVDFITTPEGSGFIITSSLKGTSGCGGGCSSCG